MLSGQIGHLPNYITTALYNHIQALILIALPSHTTHRLRQSSKNMMMASSRSFPRLLLPFSLFLLLPSSVVSLPDTFLPGPYTVDHVHFNKWVIWHVVLFKFFPREIFGSLDHAIDVYAPNTPGPKPVFMFFTGSSSWVRSKLNASKYFRTFWCCTRVGLFDSAQGLSIEF